MKEKIKRFLTILFLSIFVISIAYIIGYFYTSYSDKKDMEELQNIMNFQEFKNLEPTQVITENKEENSENTLNENTDNKLVQIKNENLNLKEVKKVNEDIVAWVKIDGTKINYPILQAKDNDYYLYRNYKKEYSRNGSIFLDYRYDFSKENQVFLLYGHNNNDDMMFNELLRYENKEFYENHKNIELITENEISSYRIVSVFKSEVYNKENTNVFKYYNYIDLSDEDVFNNYVQNIKNKSIYEINETINYGDEILVLSTCEYSKPNGRFVVVAKKQ